MCRCFCIDGFHGFKEGKMSRKDILEKLEKIEQAKIYLERRVAVCQEYIEKWSAFDYFMAKSRKYIAFAPKLEERLERMFQETLAELVQLDKIKDRDILFGVLDTADKDELWSFMEDDIEEYVNNECGGKRRKRWE